MLDAILRARLTGRVHLVGHVEDEELPSLYSAARALLFPSLYEGFGLPALEAMACGTPVVASNTTGLAEAVGDAGLTVDPRSADELAEALRRVLDEEALRERLVAAGLARAAEFTWARTARSDGRRLPRRRSHERRRRSPPSSRTASATCWSECLAALAREGVPALVCENMPDGSAELARSLGFRAYVNERPRTFAQNQNALFAATTEPYVLVAQSGRAPRAGLRRPARRARRGARALRHRRAAPARARRRPAALAPALPDDRRHARPAHAAARARCATSRRPSPGITSRTSRTARSSATGCSAPACSLRRTMLDELGGFDEGFPMYGEDIELQYRAARGGWERWYVPRAVATHDYQRVVDRTFLSRRTWWHLRGMARYVRRHPETLLRR